MAIALVSRWNTLNPNHRRLVFLLFFCIVLELVFRFGLVIDGLHFYNIPRMLSDFLSVFEPCFPADQAQRFAGLVSIVGVFHRESERLGMKYWVEYGTLLGTIRNGKAIPWDIDADVGVFKVEFLRNLPAMQQAMKNAGFALEHAPDVDQGNRYFIYPNKARWPQLKVDVYLHELRESDGFVLRSGVPDNFRWQFPMKNINPTEIRQFEGLNVRVPRGGMEFIKKYRYPSAGVVAIPYKFWCWFHSWPHFLCFAAVFCLAILPMAAIITWCCWRVGKPVDPMKKLPCGYAPA